MSKRNYLLILLFLIILIQHTFAIAIVAPTVYIVTLSITAFIANILISLTAWTAINGFTSKTYAGKKLSEILSFIFSGVKNSIIYVFSLAIVLIFIKPLDLESSIAIGILSSVIAFGLFLLVDSKKIILSDSKARIQIIQSVLFFIIFIFITSSASIFLALETKLLTTKEPIKETQIIQVLSQPISPLTDAFESITEKSVSKPPTESAIKKIEEPTQDIGQSLWIQPMNSEKCKVEIANQVFSINPKFECFSKSNLTEKTFCPVEIKRSEISLLNGIAQVKESGSCSGEAEITLSNTGFTAVKILK